MDDKQSARESLLELVGKKTQAIKDGDLDYACEIDDRIRELERAAMRREVIRII